MSTFTAEEQSKAEQEWLTVAQVARWLNLSAPTVRRLAHEGVLPAVQLGSTTLRFRRSDLEVALSKPLAVRVEEENESP